MPSTLLILAALLAADPSDAAPQATDLKAQITQLVRQLDAPERAARADAEKQLIALGPKALEFLPKPDDQSTLSAAQRDAVAKIRDKIVRAEAEAAAQASLITLHADDRPLAEVLAEIAKQSGNKLQYNPSQFGRGAKDAKVTVAFDKVPFWKVLDQVLDQTHTTVADHASKGQLSLSFADDRAAPRSAGVSYAGAFRIEATRLTAVREFRTVDRSWLSLTLKAAWEPRLHPIAVQLPLRDLRVIDDEGHPVAIDNPEGQLEDMGLGMSFGDSTEFQLTMAKLPLTAKGIGSIKGTMQVILPTQVETFEFTDLKKASQQHRAGVTVLLDEVRREGSECEVRMRVQYENPGNATESFRSWVNRNEASLLGPDSHSSRAHGTEWTGDGGREYKIRYTFGSPNNLDGMKFIYKTPVMVATVPLSFELKDLPRP